MTEERQRQFDEIVGKYKSRGERFGTDNAADRVPKKVRATSPTSRNTAPPPADCLVPA